VQSPNAPGRSLLLHVNEVDDLAIEFIRYARVRFGLYPDHDVTLAAAILHDVDKVLIYERRADGEVSYRAPYSSADHGPKGAEIALSCGVPEDIAGLVRDHSPFNHAGHLPGTIEGTIVHYADLTAADLAAVQQGRPPIHARTLIVKQAGGSGA
jgi:putative nucleotidyltransferase with HDIG domain